MPLFIGTSIDFLASTKAELDSNDAVARHSLGLSNYRAVMHFIAHFIVRLVADAHGRPCCAHACPMPLQFLWREGSTPTALSLFLRPGRGPES